MLSKGAFLVVILPLFCAAPGGMTAQDIEPPRQTEKKPPQPSRDYALALVDSAVRLAAQLDPESQGWLLLKAGNAVHRVDRARAASCYEQVMQAAEKIEDGDWMRDGAIQGFADVDLDRAVAMVENSLRLRSDKSPLRPSGIYLPQQVVLKLLARGRAEDIDKALYLLETAGDKSQYPYDSAARVVEYFDGKGDSSAAMQTFAQALAYFRKDDRFYTSPERFSRLITSSAGKVPDHLIVEAIRLVVASAKRAAERQQQERRVRRWSWSFLSEKEHIQIRRYDTFLAFTLFPIAQRLDPRLAKELREADEDLRRLTENRGAQELAEMASLKHARRSPRDPFLASRQQERYSAIQVLNRIEKEGAEHPDDALTWASGVQVAGLRALSLAALAKQLVKSQPDRAATILREAESLAGKPEVVPEERVDVLVRVAEVWQELGETTEASDAIDAGFREALERHEEEKREMPEMPVEALQGTASFMCDQLVEVETRIDAQAAMKRAESVSDDALRAYLLIAVSRELLQAETSLDPADSSKHQK
jgi:tetratricopeptide (TPR) repeat protein